MFEHSLISLDTKAPARRRWLSLPIAVALHLAALASFTFAGYWHVERVPEPPSQDVYVITASLPELPVAKIKKGGGTPPQTPVKPQTETPRSTTTAQPRDTPDTLPAKPETPAQGIPLAETPTGVGDPRGSIDGDPNGSVDGIDGVPPGGRGTIGFGTAVPAAHDEPIAVGGAVSRPVLLDGPQPRYTERARLAGTQGVVIVQATIDEKGYVTDVHILKNLPMGLTQAAVDAVRSWRFKPALLAGRPVKVYYALTVNFTLQR